MDIVSDLDGLAQQSVATIKAYFTDPDPVKADVTRAKIAASVLSTAVRFKQTQGARDALQWSMAQVLLDKEQQREYIRVSAPGSELARALPAGKTA